MDAWQPQQLKLMEVGGNAKCRNFFEEYERYASKAAAYYRSLLRAAADSSVPAPPLLRREEAAEPEASQADSANSSFDSSASPPIKSLGSQQQQQQQQDDSLLATLQQQAAAASAAAAAAAASVSSNGGAAIDTALQSVSSFVSGAKEYTAKTLEAAGETGIVEKAKGGLQSVSSPHAQRSVASQLVSLEQTLGGDGGEESASAASSNPSSSAAQQQQEEPQRSGTGVLQSVMSTAKDLTSRSLSNVSQAVRSSSGVVAEGGVFEKARESLSSLTAVATGWLQPAEVPPPAFGQDPMGPRSEEPEKFL
ncbi:hypothetical protein Emed_005824 [Eimeria media]